MSTPAMRLSSSPPRCCGVLVVNPPWHFDDEAKAIVQWLAPLLAITGPGRASVDWLVPE